MFKESSQYKVYCHALPRALESQSSVDILCRVFGAYASAQLGALQTFQLGWQWDAISYCGSVSVNWQCLFSAAEICLAVDSESASM